MLICNGCNQILPDPAAALPPSPQPSHTPRPSYTIQPTYTPYPTLSLQQTYTPFPSFTPSPSLIPTATREFLWQEEFEQGSACFSQDVFGYFTKSTHRTGKIEDGVYRIKMKGKANEIYYAQCSPPRFDSQSQFEMQTRIEKMTGQTAVGLNMVHSSFGQRTMLIFMVSNEGKYCIYNASERYRYVSILSGCWADLPDPIDPAQWIRLKILHDPGSGFGMFFVNDQLVTAFDYSSYLGDNASVGLVVSSVYADSSIEASFDRLVVQP